MWLWQKKAKFRALSDFQERNCKCGRQATQEANIGNCSVRCCENKACMLAAKAEAEEMRSALRKEY